MHRNSSSSSLDSDGDDDVTIHSAWQNFVSLLPDSEEEEEEEEAEENDDELDAGRDVVDGSRFSFKGSTAPHTKRYKSTNDLCISITASNCVEFCQITT